MRARVMAKMRDGKDVCTAPEGRMQGLQKPGVVQGCAGVAWNNKHLQGWSTCKCRSKQRLFE
jgi:hypothetical protein